MPGSADTAIVAMPLVWAAIVGYLLGSLPFGYLVARAQGINIFEHGSKSSGATNIKRVVGTRSAVLVLGLDGVKGAVAAGASLYISTPPGNPAMAILVGYVALTFALIGHSFSCFTRFKGGKGVASAAGGLFVLMPIVAAISAALWAIVFYTTRYSSVASMSAAVSLPISTLLLPRQGGQVALALTSVIAIFVVVRHRGNIVRLLNGTEKRVEFKRPERAEGGAGR
jgi:glycerol-3-phosphate acyltransferase PlsY